MLLDNWLAFAETPATTTAATITEPPSVPVRLRETLHAWGGVYALVSNQAARATYATTVTTTAVVRSHAAGETTSQAVTRGHATGRHRAPTPVTARARSAVPWDSQLEAEDELLLLLDA